MMDIFFNGKLVGTTTNGRQLVENIKAARRGGQLTGYLNVNLNEELSSIFIFLDKNRVRRPLITIRDGKPTLSTEHVEKLKQGILKWTDLVSEGVIEYLDAAEEEGALIALSEKDITKRHTHLEIDPLAIFSICSSMIPYINFSMATRLNRGQKTQKQSMGVYALNFLSRLDTNVNVLHYPQRPIVRNFTEDVFRVEKCAGQNIVIAIINYEGYNMKDAIVINKASIERGFGRSTSYRPYVTERLRYWGGQMDEICIPNKDVRSYGVESDYRFLADDGLIYPEAVVDEHNVLIGKTSPPRFLSKLEAFSIAANIRKDTSVKVRGGEKGVVSKVLLTESEGGNRLVKVKLRDSRMPEVGDKFASRPGQKGVIGCITPSEDLPFTTNGIVPDVIFSPNGLPKRMTASHIIELLAGKVGGLAGRCIDGTAFDSEPVEQLRQELLALGFREDGTETMYDGRTGRQYSARIFIGNIYYMRLKHQVADKIQARARGPVALLTRQPTAGKAKEGGLRLGEMEKETLVGHGASLLMKERFSSDKAIIYVCEKCGDLAVYNEYKNKAFCPVCGEKARVSPVEMSYAFKLFLDELKSAGIRPQLILKDKY